MYIDSGLLTVYAPDSQMVWLFSRKNQGWFRKFIRLVGPRSSYNWDEITPKTVGLVDPSLPSYEAIYRGYNAVLTPLMIGRGPLCSSYFNSLRSLGLHWDVHST